MPIEVIKTFMFLNKRLWTYFSDDKKDKKRKREEPSSFFQRQRVDVLLGELANKFPPKYVAASTNTQPEKQGRCW